LQTVVQLSKLRLGREEGYCLAGYTSTWFGCHLPHRVSISTSAWYDDDVTFQDRRLSSRSSSDDKRLSFNTKAKSWQRGGHCKGTHVLHQPLTSLPFPSFDLPHKFQNKLTFHTFYAAS